MEKNHCHLYLINQSTGESKFNFSVGHLGALFDLLCASDRDEYRRARSALDDFGWARIGGGAAPLFEILTDREHRLRSLEAKGIDRTGASEIVDAEDSQARADARRQGDDDRQMYREQQGEELERAYPRRQP